jgi:MFS family permease
VTAAGLALLAVGGSVWLAMAAMAVFGAGSAFLGSAPAALVGDVAGKRSGTVVAVFNMASDAGAVVGPVLAGFLVDHGSFTAAFTLGAVVVALAGVLGLRLPRGLPAG